MNKTLVVVHQYLPRWYTGTEQLVNKFTQYSKNMNMNTEILTFEPISKLGNFCSFFNINLSFQKKINGVKVNYILGKPDNSSLEINIEFFKKKLKKIKPKKIIFFHAMRNSGIIQAAIDNNIPYILILTDYFLICPHYSLVRKNNQLCENSFNGNNCVKICGYDKKFIKNRILKSSIIFENAEKIFVSNKYYLQNLLNHTNIFKEKIDVIDYGSFIDEQEDYTNKKKGKKFTIGYFGSFQETKGIYDLMSAIEENNNDEFIFCGSGPGLKDIEKFQKKKNNVVIKRPVKSEFLREEIKKIDIGILISKWPENMPLIIGEFLNCGKPVIVSKFGTLDEQIDHKINGFVIDEFNPKEINRGIEYCKTNYNILHKNSLLKQNNHEDVFLNSILQFAI